MLDSYLSPTAQSDFINLYPLRQFELGRCSDITKNSYREFPARFKGPTAQFKEAVTRFYCASKICANVRVKYDILFIIPSLCRTSLLCFKNWRLLHLFQSCSIILNVSLRRLFYGISAVTLPLSIHEKAVAKYGWSHFATFRSPLMKRTLDWSVETFGREYNSTGLYIHL